MSWYNSSWNRRIKITSDNTKVDSSVKGLALDLSTITSDDFWDYVDSDGADIRITEDDGETELARDVISIDTTEKEGLIRFDTSGISTSSDTDFYIYFDNSSATEPSASSTYGQYNAYPSNLKLYVPLNDGSGTNVSERTEDNDGTINGSNYTWVDGKLYGAINIDDTNAYTKVIIPENTDIKPDLDDNWVVISGNIKRYGSSGGRIFMSDRYNGSNGYHGYALTAGAGGQLSIIFGSGTVTASSERRVSFEDVLTEDEWSHFTVFFAKDLQDEHDCFANGSRKTDVLGSSSTRNITFLSRDHSIGGDRGSSWAHGLKDTDIDDFKISVYPKATFNSQTDREDYSKTIYENDFNNSDFWTIGSVEESTVTLNLEETFSSSDGDILIANRLFSETIDSDDDITNTPDYVPFVIKGKVSRDTGVENAKVYLYNQSTEVIDDTYTTNVNGDYIFINLDRDVLYSVGCVEYREENGETIRYNEKTFYDIEAKPYGVPEETFTFEGASESDSKYTRTLDAGTYEIEVHGADGGNSGGTIRLGGNGGYIKGKFDASQDDEIEIWVGEKGESQSSASAQHYGGWGRSVGGDGSSAPSAGVGGGAGGGSTEVLFSSDSSIIAVADAGGGAGGIASGGAGGGGARGGLAGDEGTGSANATDAQGTGYGGDGGDQGSNAGDGSQEAGSMLYDVITLTGGSDTTDGNGKVILRKLL